MFLYALTYKSDKSAIKRLITYNYETDSSRIDKEQQIELLQLQVRILY
jgi:hypothetical protein